MNKKEKALRVFINQSCHWQGCYDYKILIASNFAFRNCPSWNSKVMLTEWQIFCAVQKLYSTQCNSCTMQLCTDCYHCLFWTINFSLTLIRPRGGGVESTPPSTFRAIISQKFFSPRTALSRLFSFESCATFDAIFVKIGRTVPKLRNIM